MRKLTLAIVAIAMASLSGCTDPAGAQRVAEDAGYTDVQVTGHRFTGCGQHDTTSTGFRARGVTGRPVTGVVCGSWSPFGKSNTLRVD